MMCGEKESKYQLLCRQGRDQDWEHCDYAVDEEERDYLLGEYKLAYGKGWQFKVIKLGGRCFSGVS